MLLSLEVDFVAEIFSQFFALHLVLAFLFAALIGYGLEAAHPTPFSLLLSPLLSHHQHLLLSQC